MENASGSDLKQYYEDFTSENEGEAKNANKKTPTQGFYTSYTHFVSIPLLGEKIKENLLNFSQEVLSKIEEENRKFIRLQLPDLFHITICVLTLKTEEKKKAACEALKSVGDKIKELIEKTPFEIKLGGIKPMLQKNIKKDAFPKVVYFEIQRNGTIDLIDRISDLIIRKLIDKSVVDTNDLSSVNVIYDHNTSLFKPSLYHATFLRVKITRDEKYSAHEIVSKMEGKTLGEYTIKRIDISTRFETAEDGFYNPLYKLEF